MEGCAFAWPSNIDGNELRCVSHGEIVGGTLSPHVWRAQCGAFSSWKGGTKWVELNKKYCVEAIPSLKLTVRPKKWMVGILLSYWGGLFSGAMLVSGRVTMSNSWGTGVKCKSTQFFFQRYWPKGCRDIRWSWIMKIRLCCQHHNHTDMHLICSLNIFIYIYIYISTYLYIYTYRYYIYAWNPNDPCFDSKKRPPFLSQGSRETRKKPRTSNRSPRWNASESIRIRYPLIPSYFWVDVIWFFPFGGKSWICDRSLEGYSYSSVIRCGWDNRPNCSDVVWILPPRRSFWIGILSISGFCGGEWNVMEVLPSIELLGL